MSTYFDSWTEETTDFFTEKFYLKSFEDEMEALDQTNSILYLMQITLIEDTAIAVFIFSFGILLNTIILRNYWREKSTTSTYFRAFALIDIASVAFMLMRRIILFVWPANASLIIFNVLTNLIAGLYNFGPMFLAMDRCLIVAFPYNFRDHERKLRTAKGCMILVVTILSLNFSILQRFGDPDSTVTAVFGMLSGFVSVLQIIAIVVLYAMIVVKVLKSDVKMKDSRHIGNK